METKNGLASHVLSIVYNSSVLTREDQSVSIFQVIQNANAMMDHDVQIFVDGAHKDHLGAIGGVIFIQGIPKLYWSIHIGPSPTSTYSEARAALEGPLKCQQLQLSRATLCCDSKIIVQQLQHNQSDDRSPWCHLLHLCFDILPSMDIIPIKIDSRLNSIVDTS